MKSATIVEEPLDQMLLKCHDHLHPLTKSKSNFVDQKYDGDYISKIILEMTTNKVNS
jgi:hypothetical protein